MEIRIHHFKCCGNSLTSYIGSSGRIKFPPLFHPQARWKCSDAATYFSVWAHIQMKWNPSKWRRSKELSQFMTCFWPMISVWLSCGSWDQMSLLFITKFEVWVKQSRGNLQKYVASALIWDNRILWEHTLTWAKMIDILGGGDRTMRSISCTSRGSEFHVTKPMSVARHGGMYL